MEQAPTEAEYDGREAVISYESNQQEDNTRTSVPTNISATFSGIGYVIVDVNSLVLTAIKNYNLEIKELPIQTVYSHFEYILQNLKTSDLGDVRLYCEPTEDPWMAAVLRTLGAAVRSRNQFLEYQELPRALQHDRIALLLASSERIRLLEHCYRIGIYAGILESLCFDIPYARCNIQLPSEILIPNAVYHCESWNETFNCDLFTILYSLNLEPEKINEEFFQTDFCFDFERLETLLPGELAVALATYNSAAENPVFFDGRIAAGKRRRAKREPEISSKLVPWEGEPPFDWSGKDLELNMAGGVEKMNPRHLANIRRSAMSMHGGRFQYTNLTREAAPKKGKVSAKMQRIIDQNTARIRAEKEKEDNNWLKNFYKNYEKLKALQSRKAYLEGIKPHSTYIENKIMLLRIELYMEEWNVEKHSEKVDESVLIPLYLACLEYIERNAQDPPSDPELEFALTKLVEGGFEATVRELVEKYSLQRFTLPFQTDTTSAPNDVDLYFQLKYAGEYLKRTLGTQKDARVPFDPDRWQVELLDAVDAGASAIVSAPTSSGKTFICFYAIEKILRSSDKDVVVFCLPTKALVNQVTADVYARFTPKNCATVLQGTLMPDRSSETFNCQVLITIPSMLESLLASKPCDNIKYIIIDEVHKINDEALGVSLERVIHLAKCPLLLLSATIGNLDSFYLWFQSVEAKKDRECKLVKHEERFCELKMHLYGPRKSDNTYSLVPLNKMFAYSHSHLRSFGFGRDLSFLPEELLNLYYYTYMALRKGQRKLIKKLAPKNFFGSNIICKADVKRYEKHMLETLEGWIKSGELEEDQVKKIYDLIVGEAPERFETNCTESQLFKSVLQLLDELKEKEMLPVILFNTDRDLVTRLARAVYGALEQGDIRKRKDRAVERMKKEAKRGRDVEKTRDAWIEESIAAEQVVETEARDIRFTYLDPATRLSDYEVGVELAEARGTHRDILNMAYRGVGVHHSAMGRKYRSAIEILFRKKHVRVLFATDTLALGVNMPCRTVVFAGDTLKLDPMNYRQMAGRAGRRGYDTLGHVVFLGIPQARVQNLLVSRLPEIRGGYVMGNASNISLGLGEAAAERPLLAVGSIAGQMEKLRIGDEYTFKVLETVEGRRKLLEYQRKHYPFVFMQNYLWDLVVANRASDPGVFVFGLLVANDCLIWKEEELALVVAHFFEVRSGESVVLRELPEKCREFLGRLDEQYNSLLTGFYSPQLQTLSRMHGRPLHYVRSFIFEVTGPKNSYVYDFFMHGSPARIQRRNGVSVGELWQSLNNIDRLLVSFMRMMERCFGLSDFRVKRLRDFYAGFDKKYKEMYA